MARIQSFIITTKKAEKDLREIKKKQTDPFKIEEKKMVMIVDTLPYETGVSTFRCTLRHARRGECSSNEEYDDIKHIANFISNVEWGTDLKEEGGITWLGFYILYRIQPRR